MRHPTRPVHTLLFILYQTSDKIGTCVTLFFYTRRPTRWVYTLHFLYKTSDKNGIYVPFFKI